MNKSGASGAAAVGALSSSSSFNKRYNINSTRKVEKHNHTVEESTIATYSSSSASSSNSITMVNGNSMSSSDDDKEEHHITRTRVATSAKTSTSIRSPYIRSRLSFKGDDPSVDMGYEKMEDLDQRYEQRRAQRLQHQESPAVTFNPTSSSGAVSSPESESLPLLSASTPPLTPRLSSDATAITTTTAESTTIAMITTTAALKPEAVSAMPDAAAAANPSPNKHNKQRRAHKPIIRTISASSSCSSQINRRILSPTNSESPDMDFDDENNQLGGSILARSLMGLAMELTSQEWSQLEATTSSNSHIHRAGSYSSQDGATTTFSSLAAPPPDLEFDDWVERITALLLVRLLAVAAPPRTFPDLSTLTICRTVLTQPNSWPDTISRQLLLELQQYVTQILRWYRPHVPYHNAEHAYHVTVSTNKLLDLMLGKHFGQKLVPPTFGLRTDATALMSCLFAALVHDVDHRGVPNRQLATEDLDHPLAIKFNDQSIAENQSLFLAFDELLHGISVAPGGKPKPRYETLRSVLCSTKRDYLHFRKTVINLVLNTDIASPEKTQLSRSKFKEANFEGSVAAAAVAGSASVATGATATKMVNATSTEEHTSDSQKGESSASAPSSSTRRGGRRRRMSEDGKKHSRGAPRIVARRMSGASRASHSSTNSADRRRKCGGATPNIARWKTPGRSVSNTLHDAAQRRAHASSASEESTQESVSSDDAEESYSSEVSSEDSDGTQVTTNTGTSSRQRKIDNERRQNSQSEHRHQYHQNRQHHRASSGGTNSSIRPINEHPPPPPHSQSFARGAVEDGVQLTFKTASASDFDDDDNNNKDNGEEEHGIITKVVNTDNLVLGSSVHSERSADAPPSVPRRRLTMGSEDLAADPPPPPFSASPGPSVASSADSSTDKMPAVPQRRLSTETGSQGVIAEQPLADTSRKSAETEHAKKTPLAIVPESPASSKTSDKMPAVPKRRLSTVDGTVDDNHNEVLAKATKQEDKKPATPQRYLTQESAHFAPVIAINSSSSTGQPPLVPNATAPDSPCLSATSDQAPEMPYRRASVTSTVVTQSGAVQHKMDEDGAIFSSSSVNNQRPQKRAVGALPVSHYVRARSTDVPVDGDKTPGCPTRRASNDTGPEQVAASESQVPPGTQDNVAATIEKTADRLGHPSTRSDKIPSVPQRRLTALGCVTTEPASMEQLPSLPPSASKFTSAYRMSNGVGSVQSAPVLHRPAASSASHQRRSSVDVVGSKKIAKPKRLGIRRSMDLTGEMLQQYHSHRADALSLNDDQPDELKASVVLEIIMTAADVSQNLQSWNSMIKWSNKLYMELRRAHVAGRGPDVSRNWFRNQIGFLELYVLPLARKLDETGVFGPMVGPSFARLVEANRDRWVKEGEQVTADVIEDGKILFPDDTPIPEEEDKYINPELERSLKIVKAGGSASDVSAPGPNSSDLADTRERELNEAREKLSTLLETHQKEIAKISSNHHSKVDDLEHELEEMTEELVRARNKISVLKRERDEAIQAASLQKEKELELAALREKTKTLEAENGTSRQVIEQLRSRSDEEHSTLITERQKLVEEKERFRQCLRELYVDHVHEAKQLVSSIKNLEMELSKAAALGHDLADLQARLADQLKGKARVQQKLSRIRPFCDDEWKDSEIEGKDSFASRDFEVAGIMNSNTATTTGTPENSDVLNKYKLEREILEQDKRTIFAEMKNLLVLQHEKSLELLEKLLVRQPTTKWSASRVLLWIMLAILLVLAGWELVVEEVGIGVVCAPAMPGYWIRPNDVLEAPWWAPTGFKSDFFNLLCGGGLAERVEYDGETIKTTQSAEGKDTRPTVFQIASSGGFVGIDTIFIIDEQGTLREYDTPWVPEDKLSQIAVTTNIVEQDPRNFAVVLFDQKEGCSSWFRFVTGGKCEF